MNKQVKQLFTVVEREIGKENVDRISIQTDVTGDGKARTIGGLAVIDKDENGKFNIIPFMVSLPLIIP